MSLYVRPVYVGRLAYTVRWMSCLNHSAITIITPTNLQIPNPCKRGLSLSYGILRYREPANLRQVPLLLPIMLRIEPTRRVYIMQAWIQPRSSWREILSLYAWVLWHRNRRQFYHRWHTEGSVYALSVHLQIVYKRLKMPHVSFVRPDLPSGQPSGRPFLSLCDGVLRRRDVTVDALITINLQEMPLLLSELLSL